MLESSHTKPRHVSPYNFHLFLELSSETTKSTSSLSNIVGCYKNVHSPWPNNLLHLHFRLNIQFLSIVLLWPHCLSFHCSGHSPLTELQLLLCPILMQSFPLLKKAISVHFRKYKKHQQKIKNFHLNNFWWYLLLIHCHFYFQGLFFFFINTFCIDLRFNYLSCFFLKLLYL